MVGAGDVFRLLQRRFEGAPDADVNGEGGVTLNDLFDLLPADLAGRA